MNYAKLDGENIVITIPASDLSGAAYQGLEAVGCEYDDDMDYANLARDLVVELNSESEDGATLVSAMLDAAVSKIISEKEAASRRMEEKRV